MVRFGGLGPFCFGFLRWNLFFFCGMAREQLARCIRTSRCASIEELQLFLKFAPVFWAFLFFDLLGFRSTDSRWESFCVLLWSSFPAPTAFSKHCPCRSSRASLWLRNVWCPARPSSAPPKELAPHESPSLLRSDWTLLCHNSQADQSSGSASWIWFLRWNSKNDTLKWAPNHFFHYCTNQDMFPQPRKLSRSP